MIGQTQNDPHIFSAELTERHVFFGVARGRNFILAIQSLPEWVELNYPEVYNWCEQNAPGQYSFWYLYEDDDEGKDATEDDSFQRSINDIELQILARFVDRDTALRFKLEFGTKG